MRMAHAIATSIILSSLASSSLSAQDSPISVEDLGRGVFDALVQGSFDALVPYLMTPDDFEQIVDMYPGVSDEQRKEALADKDAIIQDQHRSVAERFDIAREQSWWASARFVGVRLAIHGPDGDRMIDPATLVTEDHKGAQVYVVVSVEDGERHVNLRDCIRTDRGWIIAENVSFGLSRP